MGAMVGRQCELRRVKTGDAPMGDRGVSTWKVLRWGTDSMDSPRAEHGGCSRVDM